MSQKGIQTRWGSKFRLEAAVLLDMAGNTLRAASLLRGSTRDGTSGKQCDGCVSAARGFSKLRRHSRTARGRAAARRVRRSEPALAQAAGGAAQGRRGAVGAVERDLGAPQGLVLLLVGGGGVEGLELEGGGLGHGCAGGGAEAGGPWDRQETPAKTVLLKMSSRRLMPGCTAKVAQAASNVVPQGSTFCHGAGVRSQIGRHWAHSSR